MTTNNYQVNVNNVQGNVNIQINGEKTERVSSPGPEKHYSSGASSSLLDVACLIGTGLINVACLVGIGLIEGLNFSFTKVICPSLGFVAEKTTLLLCEKIETPEVLPLEPVPDKLYSDFDDDYSYHYLMFWRYGTPKAEDIRINITDRHQYSTEIMRELQKERFPKELYGCSKLSSKTKLVETLILEQ